MFIRQVKKKNAKNGKTFYQYQLVQASRIDGKVKQRQVLYLGSDNELKDNTIRKEVLEQLQAKIFKQPLIFGNYSDISKKLTQKYYQKYLFKYPDDLIDNKIVIPMPDTSADYQEVDIKNVATENTKTFGSEHLCKQITEKLDLSTCFKQLGFDNNENTLAQISIISRAIFASSEHKTAQYLQDNSSLKYLFNIPDVKITHHNLYKITDKLYQHKTQIDKYLYDKIVDIFSLNDSIVIYDLSNTHFEGRKQNSEIAQYGKNKQKRNDCKQVVFTGIINSEGFMRHSRVYEGDKADSTTIKDMISDLEVHNVNTKDKIVVIDAGFATKENLEYLDKNGYKYVCVSRQKPNDEIVNKIEVKHNVTDRLGNKIELSLFEHPEYRDTWMYVKSQQKRKKESSMTEKLSRMFEQETQAMSDGLRKKGTTKKIEKVWERIGRLKERNRNISGKYNIDVIEQNGKAVEIKWAKKQTKEKTDKKHGVYFIRTNLTKPTEQLVWETYNLVREVEATFRSLKSELNIRPVHHQNDDRIESHIYLTMLAYQLVNTTKHMLKEKDIHHDWTNIVRIMNTQSLQEVVLPMKTKTLKITTSSKPIQPALEIYKATGTKSMIKRKQKYVVYH